MKCLRCNSEIEQDAQFCPYCGTKVEYSRCCVKCGKPLDEDSDFCPYCGTKQGDDVEESVQVGKVAQSQEIENIQEVVADEPQKQDVKEQPQEKKIAQEDDSVTSSNSVQEDLADTVKPFTNIHSSKKRIWIICALLGLFCITGGFLYFSSNTDSNFYGTGVLSSLSKDSAEDSLRNRLSQIYSQIFDVNGKYKYSERYDRNFCTNSYILLKQRFDELYEKATVDLGPLGDYDHWNNLDAETFEWKIIETKILSKDSAIAKIQITTNESVSSQETILKLAFERGNWYVDDFLSDSGFSEREDISSNLETLRENPSKYDFPNFGKAYNIDGDCLSYQQMKSIARNELPTNEIDLYAMYSFYKTNATGTLRDYQTPLYYNLFGSYFEVHIATVNGKSFYNFFCKYKNTKVDHNEEYFEKLCSDLKEDTENVITMGVLTSGEIQSVASDKISHSRVC